MICDLWWFMIFSRVCFVFVKAGFWSLWKKNPTRDKQAAAQRNLKCPSTHVFVSPVGFSKADRRQISMFAVSLCVSRLICQCHVFMCLPDSRQVPWKVDEGVAMGTKGWNVNGEARVVCACLGQKNRREEKRREERQCWGYFPSANSRSYLISLQLLQSWGSLLEKRQNFFKNLSKSSCMQRSSSG